MNIQTEWFIALNRQLSKMPVFWLNITHLGDALVLFPLLSLLIFKYPQAWAALFGSIPLSATLSIAGKNIFNMPRPAAVIDHSLFTNIGSTITAHNSLPSGHTITIIAALIASLGIIIPLQRSWSRRCLWIVCAVSLSLVIAISRIAVGAHWPLDLVLGAIFGYLGGVSGVILTQKYRIWWQWIMIPKYQLFCRLTY